MLSSYCTDAAHLARARRPNMANMGSDPVFSDETVSKNDLPQRDCAEFCLARRCSLCRVLTAGSASTNLTSLIIRRLPGDLGPTCVSPNCVRSICVQGAIPKMPTHFSCQGNSGDGDFYPATAEQPVTVAQPAAVKHGRCVTSRCLCQARQPTHSTAQHKPAQTEGTAQSDGRGNTSLSAQSPGRASG